MTDDLQLESVTDYLLVTLLVFFKTVQASWVDIIVLDLDQLLANSMLVNYAMAW